MSELASHILLETGASAYADPTEPLTDALFGARYISYRGLSRFLEQTDDLDLGLIVWPGGSLAEARPDRYGFDFDGLQNPANNKPDLSDMMALAVDRGADLSVVLPTARYHGDLAGLEQDLDDFLSELLAGDYGTLPDRLIFEVGNEYYVHFDGGGSSAAAQYGAVADVMVRAIADALADPAVNLIGADLEIALQSGRTLAEDDDIRAALSGEATGAVDMLVHHRFARQPEGVDERIAEYDDVIGAWRDESGEAPDLFLSAWNTASRTRDEVLDDYLDEMAARGILMSEGAVDLEGRTNVDFERYWQEALDDHAYGQEHAAYLLESFHSYAELGMDAAALYGVDTAYMGRVSWREDGQDYNFIGSDMLEMIHESVDDTYVLRSSGEYDPNAPATTYGFENEDKLVVFVAAGATAPGALSVSFDGIGSTYTQVWAERLTGEVPADWMDRFDVPDNAAVDEGNEAEGYTMGTRTAFKPELVDGALDFTLDSGHEVVRLAFAKTAAGAAEIASWSSGDATDLAALSPGDLPTCDLTKPDMICNDGEDDDLLSEELAFFAESAGSGGAIGLLLALLFVL